ncbi:hypothetical protein LTR60_005042, partial [Cryomyces antarcticus]
MTTQQALFAATILGMRKAMARRDDGYKRYIISRNPPRFDADGDEVDEEDYEEQGDASPLVDDPYEDIKLENLLAPLESAAE